MAKHNDDLARDALLRSIDGPDWAARAKSAERLAALYAQGGLDPVARRRAEDAFRVLRFDGETVVRRLLAECLREVARVPRDIAYSLATDKVEVAVPFIAVSPALLDHDLLTILREHPGPHRSAIARRVALSGQVSDALCRCGEEEPILALLANDTAAIAEVTLHFILENPVRCASFRDAVARRKRLPLAIGERLRALRPGARAA